jgi:hypothetical protein
MNGANWKSIYTHTAPSRNHGHHHTEPRAPALRHAGIEKLSSFGLPAQERQPSVAPRGSHLTFLDVSFGKKQAGTPENSFSGNTP